MTGPDDDFDGDLCVTVDTIVRDEGTIVIFSGTDEAGREIHFGVDHRLAIPLADGLLNDPTPPVCYVAPWQVLSVFDGGGDRG